MSGPDPADEPYRMQLRVTIEPADQAEFEKAWLDMAALAERQPANLGQWLCRDLDDAGVYHVISDWTDRAAFRAFTATPGHAEHTARLRELWRDRSVAAMSIVHGLPGRRTEQRAP